ncbi:MAG TPA: hypothetical protein VIK45_11285 [Candidatus Dormibacteraeota bacterium]
MEVESLDRKPVHRGLGAAEAVQGLERPVPHDLRKIGIADPFPEVRIQTRREERGHLGGVRVAVEWDEGSARPSVDWRGTVDYGERVVDGERFLFSYCRFCGERLAGASLRRYDRTRAARRLRFSVEHHLYVGCPAQPPEQSGERPPR